MKHWPLLSQATLVCLWIGSLLQAVDCVFAAEARTNRSVVQSIDLATALRLAGAQNLDIQIARQRLAEARANYESSTWQFFPTLIPGASYRRHDNLIQNVEGRMLEVHKESYTIGPSITGQLDLGEVLYRNLAARQLVKAADYAYESQRHDSIVAAAQSYFDLLKARSAIQVASNAVTISDNYHQELAHAVSAGIAFQGDLLRVQVQSEKNRLTLRQAQEQERVAAVRLAQVLRLDPAIDLQASDKELLPLQLTPADASLDALITRAASRPEFKQSRALIEAAKSTKAAATYGPLIPSLGAQIFVGGLGGGADGSRHHFAESEDYAVTLGWRIGPGGLFDRGRMRAAEARLTIAELTGDKLHDEITKQVTESVTRVQSQADQLKLAQRSIDAAQETLQLSQQRREFGVGAVLEAIQAEQELTRSRLDYVTAVSEFNKAQYGLLRAIGDISSNEEP
jgi:outer membrane protein TolC